jgi:hypothetical protein
MALKRSTFLLVLVNLALVAATGCGGTSGGGCDRDRRAQRSRQVSPSLTIAWAARSRDVSAPTSALSAVVSVSGDNGSKATFTAERPTGTGAVSQAYPSGADITVTGSADAVAPGDTAGKVSVHVDFYATSGTSGGAQALVATADAHVDIRIDGGIASAITNVQGKIASVQVTPDQKVNVGSKKFLGYSARNADGALLALAPGSAFFTTSTGADLLAVSGEVGTGRAGGSAAVVATIDGVASPPTSVTVVPAPAIALVADANDPGTIALQQQLQSRGITPARFDDIPDADTLQQFDVLMVWSAGQVTSLDASKVKAFLDAGRGVVLLGDAPIRLSGGEANMPGNTAAIAPWFAGVSTIQSAGYILGSGNLYVRSNAAGSAGSILLPLPDDVASGAFLYGHVSNGTGTQEGWMVAAEDIGNPSADRVAVTEFQLSVGALAYEVSSGGRLYWQGHPYAEPGNDGASVDKTVSLLLAGTDWVARR